MDTLKIVAVASSEETRGSLYKQLESLGFIRFDGVYIELSDAVAKCQSQQPDVIIVEMSGRELDAGLFIQAIGMNPEHPCVIFALHREMDLDIFKEAIRRGAKDFIQYPNDQESLEMALKKHHNLLSKVAIKRANTLATHHADGQKKPGKLITVFSSKGGAGCSTVAVNVACEIRQSKPPSEADSVIYLDLDQFYCNSEVLLALKPEYSLGDLSGNNPKEVDEPLINKITLKHDMGLHAIVGSKSVLDDHDLISSELLETVLNHLIQKYDYIIVDLPTHVLDPYHQYLVERADMILLVSGSDIPSLFRTRQYLDLAQRYLDVNRIKLVLNRYNLKAAYGMTNQDLEAQFNFNIFSRIPNDWDLCVEASSMGLPLSRVNPKSDIVKVYQKMAAEITGNPSLAAGQSNTPTQNKPSGGLLGKLFGAKSTPVKGNGTNVIQQAK